MRIAKGHLKAFSEIIAILVRHRSLTVEMAKQDLFGRFAGQAFGGIWAIAHPMFLMLIYLFVFVVVFKQKVGGTIDMPRDFPTYLLAGLIPWLASQETMTKGVTAIIAHSNLVKQVVFPIEILPVKAVVSSLFTQCISLTLLIVYSVISTASIPWTYALIPVILVMQVLFMAGIAFVLAPAGAYFRDLKDIVQILAVAGPFLIPAFYLPSQIPELFRPILYLNPFSYMVWVFQDVLYFGRIEHPVAWIVFSSMALMAFVFGYRMFRKAKCMLGNVL